MPTARKSTKIDASIEPSSEAIVENAPLAPKAKSNTQTLIEMLTRDTGVRKFVQRVEVETDAIQMRIDLASLDEALATDTELQHTVPIASVRVGKQLKLAIPPGEEKNPTRKDPALIKMVVQALTLRDRMTTVSATTFDALASELGYSREHTADLLRISYLAPDILTGILEGRQPENLSRRALMKMPRLPRDWSLQRQTLGFG